MICPCKGCDKRLVGCHTFCPDYKGYKDEIEKDKKKASDMPELPRKMIQHIWRKMRWK